MYFAEPRPTRTPGTLPVSHVAYEEVSNTVPCLEGQHFLTCSFVPVVVKRGTANHYVSISHVTVSLHVTTLEFVLVLPIQQMSIRTWKDLLLPKDQDTRVFLRRDEKGRCHTTVNVSLSHHDVEPRATSLLCTSSHRFANKNVWAFGCLTKSVLLCASSKVKFNA